MTAAQRPILTTAPMQRLSKSAVDDTRHRAKEKEKKNLTTVVAPAKN
jgi:hypothetical protein